MLNRNVKAPLLAIVLLALCPALASHARAATVYCFNGLTYNSGYNTKVGEDQLRVTISSVGAQVKMHFANLGPKASSITRIYFDDRSDRLGSFTMNDSGAGVAFSSPGNGGWNLPGRNNATPAFETSLKVGANSPVSSQGINPGEWLDLVFSLQKGGIADLLNDLKRGKLRIGLHVQAFKNGGSESFINDCKPCYDDEGNHGTPIPLPSAGALGLAGLGCLAAARRR